MSNTNTNPPRDDLGNMLEGSADKWNDAAPDIELIGEVLIEADALAKAKRFGKEDFDRFMDRLREITDDRIKLEDAEADLRALLP